MARPLPLNVTASVTLDGSGNGTAQAGPSGTNEVWSVSNVSVSASSNTNEAICKIYAGVSANASSFMDGTTWGSTGDSTSNVGASVYVGMQVFAVWSGGDSGARATMVITGTKMVP